MLLRQTSCMPMVLLFQETRTDNPHGGERHTTPVSTCGYMEWPQSNSQAYLSNYVVDIYAIVNGINGGHTLLAHDERLTYQCKDYLQFCLFRTDPLPLQYPVVCTFSSKILKQLLDYNRKMFCRPLSRLHNIFIIRRRGGLRKHSIVTVVVRRPAFKTPPPRCRRRRFCHPPRSASRSDIYLAHQVVPPPPPPSS